MSNGGHRPEIPTKRPAHFVGTSLSDLRKLPEDVQDVFGKCILKAQWGGKSQNAEPLKVFTGSGVLEIREEYEGNTYRTVYTTRMPKAIYVLHVFLKKSAHGIKTAPKDMAVIGARLKIAERDYANRYPKE